MHESNGKISNRSYLKFSILEFQTCTSKTVETNGCVVIEPVYYDKQTKFSNSLLQTLRREQLIVYI
jgi:hypothetical protein